MKRTTLFLEEELESDLRILAAQRKKPVAVLVRAALNQYVEQEKRKSRSILSFVGAGRSGRKDTAERHEDLLWRKNRTKR